MATESVTGPGGAVSNDAFAYNAVGNRTSREHTPGGGAVQTTLYTYDDRDRTLLEGGVSLTWDANGRLTSKSDGTSNAWDSEGRLLLTALAAGGSVTHDYDADGNRVRTTSFPAGGGAPDVTNFLVDARQGLSHVIVEYRGRASSRRSTCAAATVAGGVEVRRHALLSRRRARLDSRADG